MDIDILLQKLSNRETHCFSRAHGVDSNHLCPQSIILGDKTPKWSPVASAVHINV
jgi:hypothetical protein